LETALRAQSTGDMAQKEYARASGEDDAAAGESAIGRQSRLV